MVLRCYSQKYQPHLFKIIRRRPLHEIFRIYVKSAADPATYRKKILNTNFSFINYPIPNKVGRPRTGEKYPDGVVKKWHRGKQLRLNCDEWEIIQSRGSKLKDVPPMERIIKKRIRSHYWWKKYYIKLKIREEDKKRVEILARRLGRRLPTKTK